MHLLFDTGTRNLTLLDVRPQTLGGLTNASRTSGSTELIPAQIKQLRLQGNNFDVKDAFVRAVPQESLRDFDGLIGPIALGITRFSMNFATNQIYFELKNSPN